MQVPPSSKKEQHWLFLKVRPEHSGRLTWRWVGGCHLSWKTLWTISLKSDVTLSRRGSRERKAGGRAKPDELEMGSSCGPFNVLPSLLLLLGAVYVFPTQEEELESERETMRLKSRKSGRSGETEGFAFLLCGDTLTASSVTLSSFSSARLRGVTCIHVAGRPSPPSIPVAPFTLQTGNSRLNTSSPPRSQPPPATPTLSVSLNWSTPGTSHQRDRTVRVLFDLIQPYFRKGPISKDSHIGG